MQEQSDFFQPPPTVYSVDLNQYINSNLRLQLEAIRYWERRREQEEEDKRLAMLLMMEHNAAATRPPPGIAHLSLVHLNLCCCRVPLIDPIAPLKARVDDTEADALIARQIFEKVTISLFSEISACPLSNRLHPFRWKKRKNLERKWTG